MYLPVKSLFLYLRQILKNTKINLPNNIQTYYISGCIILRSYSLGTFGKFFRVRDPKLEPDDEGGAEDALDLVIRSSDLRDLDGLRVNS